MRFSQQQSRALYRIRLERGEDVLATLVDFCTVHRIAGAHFSGIGAIEDAEVGAYLLRNRAYVHTTYAGIWEVCSLMGNVALVDGTPFVHAHVVISNEHNETIGGHLFGGTVGVTLEVVLTAYEEGMSRSFDDTIGLKLLEP